MTQTTPTNLLPDSNVVVDPPCNITEVVWFVHGICPISGDRDCRDCISNEFEKECVDTLLRAEHFGYV